MNRRSSESIKRLGFRKWYERQLLSSHAHFVLAFLSALALAGTVEAYRGAQGDEAAIYVLSFLACGAIGAWALRRYSLLMMRAEEAANQASCPDCGEYGRFSVVRHREMDSDMSVRCTRCSCEWAILND